MVADELVPNRRGTVAVIECDVDPVIGSFEVAREVESTRSPDAPLVRVTGTAFMGAVEVKVIDPNAPSWFEKLRARWTAGAGWPRSWSFLLRPLPLDRPA